MARVSRSRRVSNVAIGGRRRAQFLSDRLGVALREARRDAGLTQAQAAGRVGMSQTRFGDLERGLGRGASVETWATAAASVGESLAAFLERAPGAERPRDIEHLRRQNAIVERAAAGGWTATPELAIDPGARRSRSIDVALVRPSTREAVVVEVWDWLDDDGEAWRSLGAKTATLHARRPTEGWRTAALFVVRATRRNRRLVSELEPLFRARFPGCSAGWLRALGGPTARIPDADGLAWSLADWRLVPVRFPAGRAAARPARLR